MAAQNWWEEVEEVDSPVATTEETPWWETVEVIEDGVSAPTTAAAVEPVEPTVVAEPVDTGVEKPWYEQVEIVEPVAPRVQPPTPAPELEEGFIRQAADLPVQFAIGVNNTVKGLADLFGADNPVSRNLSENVDWYRSLLSASAKADEEEVGRILQEAEGAGVLDQLAIGLRAFSVAPLDFVASGAGSLAVFAATSVLGKIAAGARATQLGLRGAEAAKYTERAVLGAQALVGTGLGAGIVKGEIYTAVKDEMLSRGLSEEEAKTIAMDAQSYGGKNLDQILLGAGLGMVASVTGANAIIARALGKSGRPATDSLIKSVLKNGFVEAATETTQATQEKVAANLALIREGTEGVTPFQGALAQGALEGAVGFALGAGGAVLEPRIPTPQSVAAAASETKSAAQDSKGIAPATADIVAKQAEQVIEQVGGETMTIPATVTPRREGETDAEWRARTERERAETPEQALARLRQEEKEAAGDIELEEEPPVSELPAQPVTPTPEAPPVAPVAPVEPVVPKGAPAQPAAVAAPTKPVAPTEPAAEPAPAVAPRPAVDVEALSPNAKRANRILTNAGVDPETAAFVSQQYQDDIANLGGEELRAFILDKFEENGGVIPAQMRYSEDQEYYELAFGIGPEEAATLVENAKGQNAQMAQNELEQNKQWRRKDEQAKQAQQGVAVAQPEAQAVPIPTGEVPPSPAIEGRRVPLAAPEAPVTPTPTEVAPEPPALAPLRRVVKAEQTEDDVSGLVGQGLVELYKGQPVITQAGLEALPEAERPRLTPEARKIQIDTRTSEAAAEAISKNLRIGVDQVPVDVKMPEGWTIDGDIYIPPVMEAAPEARGTVAGIVGEPTVTSYENQQSQNRSRLEKEVAAVPAPAWGTTQDQKRNSIVGFRDQWVGRWNNVLGRAGLSVRVDQRPVDEAGNKWKGTSRVQIQPDGQLSVVVGRGAEELALRQGDQEVPAKQRVALDVEEEVVHAIYLSQVLAGWDKQGDPVDYANRVLTEKTQKIRATVGGNVFRTLVGDTLRSYYKEILSPDLINTLTQRVIDGKEAESFTFLNELARMVAQKNVRGITQEEVYYSVVEQAEQWIRELLNSIRQFTTNYNLLGTEFAADMDGLIKEYQALADVLSNPEAAPSVLPKIPETAPQELQDYQIRLKSQSSQIPTPDYGTTPEQKTQALDAVRRRIVQKYRNQLSKLGFVVEFVDAAEVDANGNGIDSSVSISPTDGRIVLTFGNQEMRNFARSEASEADTKAAIAQTIDEEIIHAVHLKNLATEWDGTGSLFDFLNRRAGEKFGQAFNELGRDRFIEAFGSMLRGYYRSDLTNEQILQYMATQPQLVLANYSEIVRQLTEMQTRGDISESLSNKVLNYVVEFFQEILDSINALTSSPEYQRSSLKQEVDAVASAFKAVIAQPKPEARESRREPVTPQQDRDYLDAVERGDSGTDNLSVLLRGSKAEDRPTVYQQWAERNPRAAESLQRVADAVAKAAGFRFGPIFHGTKELFNIFRSDKYEDKLIYFSEREQFSREWARGRKPRQEVLDRINKVRAESKKYVDGLFEAEPSLTNNERDLAIAAKHFEKQKEFERQRLDGMTVSEAQRDAGIRLVRAYLRADNIFDPTRNWREFLPQILTRLGITSESEIEPSVMKGIQDGNYLIWEDKNVMDAVLSKYDAIRIQETSGGPADTIAVRDPAQIKLADPVTYDDAGNIIPPSQRFQPTEADIRYARGEAGVGMTSDAVRARLEALGFGVDGMIRIVEDPQAAFEGRTIIQDGKAVRIELNASALRDNAAIDRVLNHEFAESANADGALNRLVERLTTKEKKEINDAITRLGYEERVRTTEEAARAIEALAAAWKGRGFFERAVARIQAWGSKLGFKLTRKAAEYIAARNLAEVSENVRKWHISDALANLNGARRVNVGGVQAILIPPSEMQVAYSIAAYHGTPHKIKGGFQLAKVGTGEGAQAYGWGLYFAENIDVAREYQAKLSRNRFREEAALIYEDWKARNPEEASIFEDEIVAQGIQSVSTQDFGVELQDLLDGFGTTEANISSVEKLSNRISGVGNLYSVEIDLNENDLFDWDLPLAEQPAILEKINKVLPAKDRADDFAAGQYFYMWLREYKPMTGIRGMSNKEASEFLMSAGIKGIRYLDQGSRAPRLRDSKELRDALYDVDYLGFETIGEAMRAIKTNPDWETRWDLVGTKAAEIIKKHRDNGTYNFVVFDENAIKITALNGQPVDIRESRVEPAPRFAEESPEAKTLSTMRATMEKVDSASEAKGGKSKTQKVSEIAANWMESGGDTRALQDAITENTNLSPANAQKVANAIARQYDIQQSIAAAFLETPAGISVEAIPEGATLPKEVDPDRPKPVMQRLFEVFMGVRVPPVKITGNEKTLLKQQIRLKAAANRAAKNEQQKIADAVVETIKEMELRGPVRPKQVAALAKRAAKVIWTSEKSVEVFTEYAAKVVENTNYDADVREAKTAQKRAKELSKQKKVAMSPQREILSQIGNVAINKLEDPRLFAETINYYLRGFKDVRSPEYVVVPDAEMTSYLSQLETEAGRDQIEVEREANERLARKYDVDPDTIPDLMGLINIIEEIEGRENREALENILTDKAIETQEGLRGYDTTPITNEQKRLVESMTKVDLKSINTQERQMFIRIANNMIYNNQTNGAEYFVATAHGQQNAREAARDAKLIQRNKAWIPLIPSFGSLRLEETLRNFSLELQSIADTFRNVFGKDFMAKAYEKMGMLNLNEGFTKANNTIDEIQDLAAEFHQGNEKKFGDAASDQDGILSEGVAGFLIQSFPFKDETVSIEQRRKLINEYITNARNSRQKPRVAMADRVEAILNKVDGNSVQEILNNLKREYPANHEVLMWYKDVLFPKYKGFLKQFDENFNDQANNYDSPNYLPISFTSAGPALAIGPEEASIANSISLQPKQSVYTIKRQDYTTLPKDRDGKPKEIEFNLRRTSFNSLSDQINKAYTSAAWQQLFAFMKTPESVDFFGDEANRDFFVDRLNRLRASRARRGSVSGGALEKALDSFSIISRKLGTGIALGGVHQWIKQPPDQLITAWGSGGRGDLLAKNLAPSNQKAARELLNLFSIGRRGDSSAGYKYINQMEGHQSRMERYFTERRFDKAKEQAGKIADVWMIALKKSDFVAASAAWMTYYEGELNKNEIYIDDWAKEAELAKTDPVRREAAAFAEQMTDIYQGSSDPTSMATFAQSGKTGWENFVKALLVPFNSFAIQQRMRLYSDARDALLGNKSGAGGLAGTIGGLILFHATKRYVIPAASGVGISVLYGLMGVDMEEPDEEKQKEMADRNWRQFLADMTGNLLVGGTPQIVESQVIQSFNRASYLVAMQLESETVMDENGEIMSFDKYSKERSPFYRYQSFDNAMSLGMFDIGFGQAKETALQTKMLMDRDEMGMYTPEEQRLLYFSALSEWLLLMRLNDTDFSRLVKKARRDMIKAVEDREKELNRIRSGR